MFKRHPAQQTHRFEPRDFPPLHMGVENRRVLGVDLQELQAQTQEDAESQWAGVADWDPLGRSADERSPYTYPLRKPS